MEIKSAIITGAGRGIGRAVAVRLAERGYKLALAARTEGQLHEAAAECEAKGAASVVAIPVDVSKEEDVLRLFRVALERFGGELGLLVNNAGIGIYGPIRDITLADWRQVLDTNLTGAFLCAREAMRAMVAQKGGTVIHVASVVGIKGYPRQGAYTASKHGLVGLAKVMAEEGREHNVRVHVICPGGVATEMVAKARPDIAPEELIQPADIAALVDYLLSMPPNVTTDLVHLRRFSSQSF